MTLGQRIALCRKQRGMTQEGLGEVLGVSRQAVSKWESDQTTPELQYIKSMCEQFHVTADWLLFEKEAEQTASCAVGESIEMETCPNCAEPMLAGAAFCPKCGQSMAPVDRPGCYTLVLKDSAYPVLEAAREVSVAWSKRTVSSAEFAELTESLPAVFWRGLDGQQVQFALEKFALCTDALEIYRDESGEKSLEELLDSGAVPLSHAAFQKKKAEENGIGFWGVLGAVVLGILIMSFL